MVKRCQWGTCNSDTRYPERLEGGITFIPFPKPKRNFEKCKRWIKACGRPHDQLNETLIDGNYHMFVCTKVSNFIVRSCFFLVVKRLMSI